MINHDVLDCMASIRHEFSAGGVRCEIVVNRNPDGLVTARVALLNRVGSSSKWRIGNFNGRPTRTSATALRIYRLSDDLSQQLSTVMSFDMFVDTLAAAYDYLMAGRGL